MLTELPQEIQRALRPLGPTFSAAQLVPIDWELSQAFGNFCVTFRGASGEFTLTRDRGQFIVDHPDREKLGKAGLLRAFDKLAELQPHLLKWLCHGGGA